MADFSAWAEKARNGDFYVRYRDGKTKLANGRWKVFSHLSVDKNQRVLVDGKERTAQFIAERIAHQLVQKHLSKEMGNCDLSMLISGEIDKFLDDCRARNLEDKTIHDYDVLLHNWQKEGKFYVLSDLTYQRIIEWRNSLTRNAVTTVYWKLTVIKSFISWLKETDKIQSLPFKKNMFPQKKEPSPKYYTLEQWVALRKALASVSPIAELACCISYSAGLRRVELVGNGKDRLGIMYEDLIWNPDGTVDLILRKEIVKGRKRGRTIRLDPGLVSMLGSRKSGPIIPLKPWDLWFLFDRARLLAGLDHIRPRLGIHTLRHSFAKNYLKYGNMDLDALRKMLGHARIGTTQIYSQHEKSDLDQGIVRSYERRNQDIALIAGQNAGQDHDIILKIADQNEPNGFQQTHNKIPQMTEK